MPDGVLLLEEGVAARERAPHPEPASACGYLARRGIPAGRARRRGRRRGHAGARLASSTRERGTRRWRCACWARSAARAGQRATAAAHYADALARAGALEMRPLEALCHLGLGELARRAGDGAAAKERLTEAVGLLREMDMRYWLDQAETALRDI